MKPSNEIYTIRNIQTFMQMTQKAMNFLGLALDDYIAARFLLRNGLLPQGIGLAATAVEKQIKALLALHNITTKKHLDTSLIAKVKKVEPNLGEDLDADFIKFLGKGFTLRYASIDSGGFSIVINQYRTLIVLDETMLNIDRGFQIKKYGNSHETPLQNAIKNKNEMILDDNVPLGRISLKCLATRPNKVHELKIAKNLQDISVQYETKGLNITGKFCKKTDIDFGKQKWQLTRG